MSILIKIPPVKTSQTETIPHDSPSTPKVNLFDDEDRPASPVSGIENTTKQQTRASTTEETLRYGRPILQSIDNDISVGDTSNILLRSPTVATQRTLLHRHSSACDTPSSFIGSPVKKKRRMSSIKRL